MLTISGIHRVRVAALCTGVWFGISGAAFAQSKTYEGDVVAVNATAMTYTVKGTTPGEQVEMAFHVDPSSQMFIGGERKLLGEMVKGDHVIVTYGAKDAPYVVVQVDRIHTRTRELSFTGGVIDVNDTARTFTVKSVVDGKAQEMKFHVNPGAQLFVGGQRILLEQIRKGDVVTVGYESILQVHHVRHVKKASTT